jgi:hypothetical protein
MNVIRPWLLLASIIAVAVVAIFLLVSDASLQARRAARAEEFQRLVGGLGFGPAQDLSRCPNSFDPRLDDGCADDDGPIPGGARYCPLQGGSIFSYPPLKRSRPAAAFQE